MSTLAAISTKGGAGKSTLASQLAIAAYQDGRNPLIFDCDEGQNSINVWARALRPQQLPEIRTANIHTVDNELAAARADGFDFIMFDVPPGGGDLVSHIASIVDHIVVPVRPALFDLLAMTQTVRLLQSTADNSPGRQHHSALGKSLIVVNGVPKTIPDDFWDDIEESFEACGAGGIPIIGTLTDLPAYSRSQAEGVGVVEMRKGTKAYNELTELYGNLDEILRRREGAGKRKRKSK